MNSLSHITAAGRAGWPGRRRGGGGSSKRRSPGKEQTRPPHGAGEEKAGDTAKRARQLAAETVGAGESSLAATGPSRTGSAWSRRSRRVYTSGSLPARTLPQLPLPLCSPGPAPREQPVCAGAVCSGLTGVLTGGGAVGGTGRPVRGDREGRK